MSRELQEMYERVAVRFAERITEIWKSEDSMKVEWERRFKSLPFSRTDHWQAILYHLFRDCYHEVGPTIKLEPTGFDRLSVLLQLHSKLDYNIFSQVLLNLQTYNGMAYLTADAAKESERIKETWKEKVSSLLTPGEKALDPMGPKPTMIKSPKTAQENEYNLTLSALRSLKIIANFTPSISFRVSPMGSTPAFADSNNVSMLGMGADKYLRVLPQLEVYYLVWAPGTAPLMANFSPNLMEASKSCFIAPDIPLYAFYSKSGGEVLHDVLFARKLMYDTFKGVDVTKSILIMLPRMNSLMFVMDKQNVVVAELLKQFKTRYPMLEIMEGSRFHASRDEVQGDQVHTPSEGNNGTAGISSETQ